MKSIKYNVVGMARRSNTWTVTVNTTITYTLFERWILRRKNYTLEDSFVQEGRSWRDVVPNYFGTALYAPPSMVIVIREYIRENQIEL